ncbi:MAG: hypothetical protein ACYDBJ_26215 [Aggregatilineales bacterium]
MGFNGIYGYEMASFPSSLDVLRHFELVWRPPSPKNDNISLGHLEPMPDTGFERCAPSVYGYQTMEFNEREARVIVAA